MRTALILGTALLLSTISFTPAVYADANGDAIATMANIVIGLKHFPGDADKAALADIAAGDASDSVKAIASAIANMQHKVSSDDDAKLAAITADPSEPSQVRELASIVSHVMHMPNADQVTALQALANQ